MVFLLFLFLGASFQLPGFFHVGPILFFVGTHQYFCQTKSNQKNLPGLYSYIPAAFFFVFFFGGGSGKVSRCQMNQLGGSDPFFGRRTKKFSRCVSPLNRFTDCWVATFPDFPMTALAEREMGAGC